MQEWAHFLHLISIALVVALTSIGVGIGGGLIGQAAIKSLYRQPGTSSDLAKASFIGLALVETAGIFSIVIAFVLMFSYEQTPSLYGSLGTCGVAAALGISGLVTGISSALPAQAAFKAIARQPFFAPKIINLMLLTQSLIQTPIIFGLLISLFIAARINSVTTLMQGLQLLASGLCIGIGSIGPTIGLGRFAYTSCYTVGVNRESYGKIVPFTLISGAIIETPLIFALIIALFLVQSFFANTTLGIITAFSAAFVMGIGTAGPGLGSARTASAACTSIGLNPDQTSVISKASLVAQALIDAVAIYALLIALLMILLK